MQDEQLSVKVSGQAVYNAVKNYLNNNEQLRGQIDTVVKQLVDAGHLQDQVQRLVREHFTNSWQYRNMISSAIKDVVAQEVKTRIELEVKEHVQKAMEKAIFVLPKLDNV